MEQNAVNPHYFSHQGKPVLLISSDHSYGAIASEAFDYRSFLETLTSNGMNFTRIYPGATPATWFGEQTLFPWLKTSGGKYDLDQWNPKYFARLVDFVGYASQKGVIVDVCLFNGEGTFYPVSIRVTPLNPENNIQNEGSTDGYAFTSAYRCPELVNREEAYLRKIVDELSGFDNVLYDICDEPDVGKPPLPVAEFTPWVERMLGAFHSTGSKQPAAETHAGTICDGVDWRADPRTTWISLEYWMGIKNLDVDYHYNKPLVLVETACFPIHYEGDVISSSRAEAWEFMVGGGAGMIQFSCDYGFNHYGYHFPLNPTAQSTQTLTTMAQKKILMQFMSGFDFIKMKPISVSADPPGAILRAIAEDGRQYACYMHHSTTLKMGAYQVLPGSYQERITFSNVRPGSYTAEWVLPSTGEVIASTIIPHPGSNLTLSTPEYSVDLALRMKRS